MSLAVAKRLEDFTEKEWDSQIFNSQKGMAPMLGWRLNYHTLRSKGSRSGFPDRVLIRDRVIFAELKTEKGKPTDHQIEFLNGLAKAGAEAYLWRPSDWDEIGRILSKRWTFQSRPGGGGRLREGESFWTPGSSWVAGLGRFDEMTWGQAEEIAGQTTIHDFV